MKIGDRVITSGHGAGVIVNRESFNKFGFPLYHTEEPLPEVIGLTRWGVKLDDEREYKWYTDGIAYYIEEGLRREH